MAEKYIFRGNIALPTRKRLHLVIFWILFHQITLWMVLYIPWTLIVSYLQKALIKPGRLLHKMVLITLGVASIIIIEITQSISLLDGYDRWMNGSWVLPASAIVERRSLNKSSPLSLSQIPRDQQIYFEISVVWNKENDISRMFFFFLYGPYPKHWLHFATFVSYL